MHEISYSLGLEYNFRDFIGLRSGYFHEHSTKGNRKYFTFGLGVMIPHFFLDLSFLSPASGQNEHPCLEFVLKSELPSKETRSLCFKNNEKEILDMGIGLGRVDSALRLFGKVDRCHANGRGWSQRVP